MKTLKNVILMVACAALLIGASVAGTLAFLKDNTDPITNTMTVGKVEITLDESKVTEYGVVDGDVRVAENSYKLIPGKKYTKDPVIHVADGSEECYLFVEVVNGIAAIEGGDTITAQLEANNWEPLAGVANMYYNSNTAAANADVKVFESFTVADNVDDLNAYADATIEITAYAVQAEGFDDAPAAWAAAFGGSQG